MFLILAYNNPGLFKSCICKHTGLTHWANVLYICLLEYHFLHQTDNTHCISVMNPATPLDHHQRAWILVYSLLNYISHDPMPGLIPCTPVSCSCGYLSTELALLSIICLLILGLFLWFMIVCCLCPSCTGILI